MLQWYATQMFASKSSLVEDSLSTFTDNAAKTCLEKGLSVGRFTDMDTMEVTFGL